MKHKTRRNLLLKVEMGNPREYCYIGPDHIIKTLSDTSGRVCVQSADSVISWIKETKQPQEYDDLVIATFIIDTHGQLWINDRRSEHVLCAVGKNVLSAGEMGFKRTGAEIEVVEVTNQSTGYCPEPESWWAVESALKAVGISHPPNFTMQFIFRLCEKCGTKNIVKDDWFECGVCQSQLSKVWNFDSNI